MSKYSFIVSNIPLPEVDFTAAKKMKYREYKKINKEKESNSILSQLDDEAVVLIMEPTKMNYLSVTICTNPPYGLEEYTQKDYIYWLEGDLDNEIWQEQLYEYLKGLNKDGLEIWSIWFGDGPQDIKEMKIKLSESNIADLEVLKNLSMNYCIKIE